MSKFIHALVIERIEYDEDDLDEANQPSPQTPTSTSVRGLVQPKATVSEADDYRSAGTQVSDHTIFLPIGTELRHADAILQGERRYNVTGIRRFEYGGLAHLEVDARLVTSTEPLVVGS